MNERMKEEFGGIKEKQERKKFYILAVLTGMWQAAVRIPSGMGSQLSLSDSSSVYGRCSLCLGGGRLPGQLIYTVHTVSPHI